MKIDLKKKVLLLLLFSNFLTAFPQVLSKKDYLKALEQADVLYYYEQNYERAAVLYESLLKDYPGNANLSAKLGICCLNIDGRNADALKMLSAASTNIVKDNKEYREYADKAPLDTYMYLAIAYHHNDSLQKAIELYKDARERLGENSTFKTEYIDNQIRDCLYALEMEKKPLTLVTDIFAQWLVDYPGAINPVLAKNDSVFVFTQKQDGKTKVFCSYKTGTWNRPTDITEQLGGFDRFYTNSITGDGKYLIVYLDDGGDGNLYYSQRYDANWSKVKSIGKPINTIYWQAHGFITPDGRFLFFSSNKPGGEGELDIWYSEKDASGEWGDPVNCGNIINTPYNEDTPFFDQQNDALIFSSSGHTSMGGYDTFRSVRKNGIWTNPVGMPYPFNTTQENNFFILNNDKPGFITSLYDDETKTRNIYEIVAENPSGKKTIAKGTVKLGDGMAIDPGSVSVVLVDLKKPDSSEKIELIDSVSFQFEITPGDYQLYVSHDGYKTDTINLSLPLYFQGNYVPVVSSLIPEKVFGGDFLSIKNILFEFNSYELDAQAKSGLEALRSILVSYPELKVVVAGYTDAKGGMEYNRKLADKRAQSVIDYLAASGTRSDRLIKKAFGKADFVALNSNNDGSDNPEGRKYNRRVTFGIVDPGTGVTIRNEPYTPEHLRPKHSMKYSIVLKKTTEALGIGYFSALSDDGLLLIKSIETDSALIYSLGVFYNKPDALKYLEYAHSKGFTEAYIVNQYDLSNESESSVPGIVSGETGNKVYTIQLKATLSKLDINKVFGPIEGIKEIKTRDGFYKYYCGEYDTKEKARGKLAWYKSRGIEDVFVKELALLLAEQEK